MQTGSRELKEQAEPQRHCSTVRGHHVYWVFQSAHPAALLTCVQAFSIMVSEIFSVCVGAGKQKTGGSYIDANTTWKHEIYLKCCFLILRFRFLSASAQFGFVFTVWKCWFLVFIRGRGEATRQSPPKKGIHAWRRTTVICSSGSMCYIMQVYHVKRLNTHHRKKVALFEKINKPNSSLLSSAEQCQLC